MIFFLNVYISYFVIFVSNIPYYGMIAHFH